MATAPYNQQPRTLADLLAMQGSGAPAGPTDPPRAPSVDTEGTITAQQRSALLDQLFAPDTPTTVLDEEPSWGKKIAGSFADAFNNIATIYAGGPDLRSNYLNSYLTSVERKNFERRQRAENQSERETRRKQAKAQFLISEDDRAKMAADALQGRKEIQAENLANRTAIAQQAADDRAAQRELAVKLQEMKDASDLKQEQARGEYAKQVARINGNIDKAQARMDKKELGEAVTFIGQTALNAKKMLSEGRTPEEIRKVVRVTLDGLTLTEDNEKAAMAYMEANLEPILQHAEIENQGPPIGSGGPVVTPRVPAGNVISTPTAKY